MCAAQWKSSLFCVAPSKSAYLAVIMTHFHDSSITPPQGQKPGARPLSRSARIFTLLGFSLWRHGLAAQKADLAPSH